MDRRNLLKNGLKGLLGAVGAAFLVRRGRATASGVEKSSKGLRELCKEYPLKSYAAGDIFDARNEELRRMMADVTEVPAGPPLFFRTEACPKCQGSVNLSSCRTRGESHPDRSFWFDIDCPHCTGTFRFGDIDLWDKEPMKKAMARRRPEGVFDLCDRLGLDDPPEITRKENA